MVQQTQYASGIKIFFIETGMTSLQTRKNIYCNIRARFLSQMREKQYARVHLLRECKLMMSDDFASN